jgi:uncharacterized protein with ParB-like and HNH nuclease domain
MNDEKLALTPITKLLGEKFYIPSYQRGYRWKNTQVKNLLDDIWNFRKETESKNKETFYCLQPVVVSKKGNEWEVIDGQQRLTTIYLILYYLKEGLSFLGKNNFSIRYETRTDSDDFLKKIDPGRKEDNIDYYHFCSALETIEKGKDGNAKINFLITLLNDDESGKNVKVIWYNVSDENISEKFAIDIFTRLNIGKIPLTNAELIKALFLSKSDNSTDSESRTVKQINIASQWDKIEQRLQQPYFWYFISTLSEKYETKIEYIFDLMKDKKEDDENYFTFYKFLEDFEQDKSNPRAIEKIWRDINEFFLTFEDWYLDRELFHLIGYLIATGNTFENSIQTLKKSAVGLTKTEFIPFLKKKAKKTIRTDLEELNFHEHKQEIRRTLLLFNILSIIGNQKSAIRFPFHYYHNQNRDIEHIRSQTSKDINGKDRENWVITLLEYFTGLKWDGDNEQEINDSIQSLNEEEKGYCYKLLAIIKDQDPDNDIFIDLYNKLSKYFEEDGEVDEPDGLSNLTLLDETTNRMYKNAFFPVKRKHIIDREKKGVFIPFCTRNVFLKAYSRRMGKIMFWTKNDASDYFSEIQKVLNDEGE